MAAAAPAEGVVVAEGAVVAASPSPIAADADDGNLHRNCEAGGGGVATWQTRTTRSPSLLASAVQPRKRCIWLYSSSAIGEEYWLAAIPFGLPKSAKGTLAIFPLFKIMPLYITLPPPERTALRKKKKEKKRLPGKMER